ncbi:MAG: hypothetical protein Q7R60_00735 [bacterium]|nr:hypothetical protein [bacterium]
MSDHASQLVFPELIVLHFGLAGRMGLSHESTTDNQAEAYRRRLRVVGVSLPDLWWTEPLADESRLHLYEEVHNGRRTPQFVKQWLEGDGFVRYVRRELTEYIGDASHNELPESGWEDRVSLVYIDGLLDPHESAYTRRVFDGWFPNAFYRDPVVSKSIPLWRDASVVPMPLSDQLKAAFDTALMQLDADVVPMPLSDQLVAALDTPIIKLASFSVQEGRVLEAMKIKTLRELIHASDGDLARVGLVGERRMPRLMGELKKMELSREGESWHEFARRVNAAA